MTPYKSVLIVEDDEGIRSTLQELLELEGYRAETASNGREALQKLQGCVEPCLILLDMMMPEMNGWEFLAARRRTDVIAAIPVIIVSAAGTKIENGLPADATGYLKKPVDLEKLLTEVALYCSPIAA